MKKLLAVLFSLAMILAPFAGTSDARGGRGGGRGGGGASRGISGGGTRSGSGGRKDQARQRDLDRSEERDSLISGELRRRSR